MCIMMWLWSKKGALDIFKSYIINADFLNFRSKLLCGLACCKDIWVKFITEPSWQDLSLGHSEAVLLSYSLSVSWKSSDPCLWYQNICFLQHHTSSFANTICCNELVFFSLCSSYFLHPPPNPELKAFDFGFKLIFHILYPNDFWLYSVVRALDCLISFLITL